MAENKTPVQLEVSGFEPREVMLVDYKFDQEVDREGQIAGIPRGGRITIRVKAMNDGNNQLLQWMLAPNDPRDVARFAPHGYRPLRCEAVDMFPRTHHVETVCLLMKL